MPIITLTTDLGESDYYTGALKGFILSHCPDARIVDISHQIRTWDILHAAFVVQNSFSSFPEGTVHLINVSAENFDNNRYLLVSHAGHYFLTHDNGLMSLIFVEHPEKIWELPLLPDMRLTFPGRDILGWYACQLMLGKEPDEFARPVNEIRTLQSLAPHLTPRGIRGSVIYIDHYGNVIVNIRQELFEEQRNGRSFTITFRGRERITGISQNYDEVPPGEKLALFNAMGYLEIAINRGKAASLLGLGLKEIVNIEFSE